MPDNSENRPTVSVVIPLYNKRKTVARTLRSVLAQTLQDLEIIVIDDGSSDGSGDEVLAVAPHATLERQVNSGPGAARNRGLKISRGEFVTFVDADDEWSPELLESAVQALRRHPECGAFTADFTLQPQGVSQWAQVGFSDGPWQLTPSTPRHEVFDCHGAFSNLTAVYRRTTAISAGGFHESHCTFGEDVPFWLRVLLHHRIYRHTRPLGSYNMADSELGICARGDKLPIEPVLTNPEIVRDACPPELRDVLELWLAKHACRAAFMQAGRGHPAMAAKLVAGFPKMRALGFEYFKLRLKVLLAQLSHGGWSRVKR